MWRRGAGRWPVMPMVYGPVRSRRFGLSLGVNLDPPGLKVCPFDCLYCQCGWTDVRTTGLPADTLRWPAPEIVEKNLAEAFAELAASETRLEDICFAGPGEPLLYPYFEAVTTTARRLRDQWVPRAKLTLLTCGAGLHEADLRDALLLFDRVIVKLDAGRPETYRRLNRPAQTLSFDRLLAILRTLDAPTVQTLFVRGAVDNSTTEEVARWLTALRSVAPQEVHLLTVDRPPASPLVRAVDGERLEQIAAQTRAALRCEVNVYHPQR